MKLFGYANCFPSFRGCTFKQEEIEMSGVITWWRCVNKTASLCSQHLYICFPVIIMPCEEALVVEWWSFRQVRSSVRPRTNTNIQVLCCLMEKEKKNLSEINVMIWRLCHSCALGQSTRQSPTACSYQTLIILIIHLHLSSYADVPPYAPNRVPLK